MNKEQLEKYLKANPFEQLNKIVFSLLFDDIATLKIAPGTKLNVAQIATELNISRTPVTEALKMLYNTGFVETFPDKSGFYVSSIKREEIVKLYTAREMIESKAAYLCASYHACPNIGKLEKLAYEYKDGFVIRDYESIRNVDIPFHQLIIESCGNIYVQQCYEQLKQQTHRFQWYSINISRNDPYNPLSEELIPQHIAIVNAIKLHMPDIAAQAMTNHINSCIKYTIIR
jgi:DNA-binding GntR family transcriptional regulator